MATLRYTVGADGAVSWEGSEGMGSGCQGIKDKLESRFGVDLSNAEETEDMHVEVEDQVIEEN